MSRASAAVALTPVYSHDSLICTDETHKNVVKMTFARGAALKVHVVKEATLRLALLLVTLALTNLVGCAVTGHPTSPNGTGSLPPRKSTSPVAAPLPADLQITPPAADLPSAQAAWSGIWSGWACRERACDTKLVVETITAAGARIVYSFASQSVPPFSERLVATFVGDSLQAVLGGGARIRYRMRPDGDLDFLWINDGDWSTGILAREK